MSDYIPVDSALELPRALTPAETLVRGFDRALRLRQSARRDMRARGCGYVLERKTLTTKPVDSVSDPDVQIATKDGYLIIDHVHVSLLQRPEAIVERLREGDLARQSAQSRFDEIVTATEQAERAEQQRQIDDGRAFYRESFDILDRLGDTTTHAERLRLNNAGTTQSSAGEIPAQESSDEHQTSAASGREGGELSDRAPAG